MTSPPVATSEPPVMDTDAIVDLACRQVGLPVGARLLRHFTNAVYLLKAAPVVARVAYGSAADAAHTAVAIARWLSTQHFPVTVPIDLSHEQPVILDWRGMKAAVTFWRYYPEPPELPKPDSTHLGNITAALHRLPPPPVALPTYQPLPALETALDGHGDHVLTDRQHGWLRKRIRDLRDAFSQLTFPLGHGFIHADLLTGNLLWDTAGSGRWAVLGDWDTACIGPREIDIIPAHHEPRFGVPIHTVQAFTAAYGYDVTGWEGFPILLEIRELSTLAALIRHARAKPRSAAELHHRLRTLVARDQSAGWHAQ